MLELERLTYYHNRPAAGINAQDASLRPACTASRALILCNIYSPTRCEIGDRRFSISSVESAATCNPAACARSSSPRHLKTTTPTIPLFPAARRNTSGTTASAPWICKSLLHVNRPIPPALPGIFRPVVVLPKLPLPSARCPPPTSTRQRTSPEQGIPDTSAASALLPLHKSLLAALAFALADPSTHLPCTQAHCNRLFFNA